MVRCEACDADAVDLDLDEPVCTQCATLYRGGLVTLVNTEDYEGRYAQDATQIYVPLQALKSIRNDGWDMAGQGSLPTNERNMISMNKFIQSFANALGHPGIAPRAQHLFAKAREHPETNIRWGKAAEICAGAALFVALRAEGYSDRTDEIAARLGVDPSEISRLLLRFLKQDASAVWNVRLAPSTADSFFDATLHFLSSNAATFPAETRGFLHLLLPSEHHSVLKMARALYDNVIRPCAGSNEIERTPAVAAAALIILALEGCLRKPVPQVLKLAAALGGRPGVGVLGPAVMERYRRALDDLETRARNVPFLTLHVPKAGKQRGGVKTDARRIQLARVAQDAVAFFASDCARTAAKAEAAVTFPSWEKDQTDEEGADDTRSRKSMSKRAASNDGAIFSRPQKRVKQDSRTTHGNARAYLLNPSTSASSPCLAASAYLLAPHAEPGYVKPTRLQQLSALRGGEGYVDDTELFAEDELEGLILRDDDEEFINRCMMLDVLVPIENKEKTVAQTERRLTPEERAKRRGLGRMNVEALRRVLGEDVSETLSADYLDHLDDIKLLQQVGEEEDDGGDEEYLAALAPTYAAIGEEEIVGEWRPPSPGVGGSFGWKDEW